MIRVDNEADQVLIAKVHRSKQEHVFRFWETLNDDERRQLLDQLHTIDFQQLSSLCGLLSATLEESEVVTVDGPDADSLRPVDMIEVPKSEAEQQKFLDARKAGIELLRAGKVAALTVAGGQGTRLGWDAPKGSYPISPVRSASLFQLFAEQILAWRERCNSSIPWIVMTSQTNHEDTIEFFDKNDCFGFPRADLSFMVQGQLPAVSADGKLILKSPSAIATSPDGHGGSITALHRTNTLQTLKNRGIEKLFYFQVDNPLCAVLDPVFLGFHSGKGAEASTKVISKTDPWEKVGVLGYRSERLCVIEYSELDDTTRNARDESGALTYRAGNIANHIFDIDFLIRLAETPNLLPFHLAFKKVQTIDDAGAKIQPAEPNGYKFEKFIFDVLGEAASHVTLEVDPAEEFEPVKNAEGKNSPETARAALIARAGNWLEFAGFGRPKSGQVVEIKASTAFDKFSLKETKASLEADLDSDSVLI